MRTTARKVRELKASWKDKRDRLGTTHPETSRARRAYKEAARKRQEEQQE